MKYPDSIKPGKPRLPQKTPKDWQLITMKDAFHEIARKVEFKDHETYNLVTVKRSRGGVESRGELVGEKILVKTQFYVKEDDFLISKRQIVHGACGIVPKELEGSIVSNEYLVLRPKDRIDLNYLKYYSHSQYFQQTCFHSSIGVHIEKMIFKPQWWYKFKHIIPTYPEQQRIVSVLQVWDQVISLNEKLVLQLTLRHKGLLETLLFQKIIGNNWQKVRLGDHIKTFSGGTPSKARPEYHNGKIPWMRSGELNQKYVRDIKKNISQEGFDNSSTKIVKEDTVLLALYGATAGVVAITKIEAAINQAILAIVPNDTIVNMYLYYLLNYLMPIQLNKLVQGGQPNLNAGMIKNLKIEIPNSEDQKNISEMLWASENEIILTKMKIATLKEQKKGLMQKLLTGEIRVKVDN